MPLPQEAVATGERAGWELCLCLFPLLGQHKQTHSLIYMLKDAGAALELSKLSITQGPFTKAYEDLLTG